MSLVSWKRSKTNLRYPYSTKLQEGYFAFSSKRRLVEGHVIHSSQKKRAVNPLMHQYILFDVPASTDADYVHHREQFQKPVHQWVKIFIHFHHQSEMAVKVYVLLACSRTNTSMSDPVVLSNCSPVTGTGTSNKLCSATAALGLEKKLCVTRLPQNPMASSRVTVRIL